MTELRLLRAEQLRRSRHFCYNWFSVPRVPLSADWRISAGQAYETLIESVLLCLDRLEFS